MNKLSFTVLFFFIICCFIYAKDHDKKRFCDQCTELENSPGCSFFLKSEKMEKILNLSEGQIEKINTFAEEYGKKIYINRFNSCKVCELKLEHIKRIESILTNEQQRSYELYFVEMNKIN